MHIHLRWFLVPSLLIAASGCPDVKTDTDEVGTGGPVVEFDPGNRIVPFPNNLLLDPTTGKVNLPQQCGEGPATTATREMVLNQLDGFGTFEMSMTATFSEPFDMASLMGRVKLYKRSGGGADPAIDVVLVPSMTARYSADCQTMSLVPQIVAVPVRPLDQKSVYTVGILAGVETAEGEPFGPSFTWSLVRNELPPVELDAEGNVTANRTPLDPRDAEDLVTLQGVDRLWKAHKDGLDLLAAKGHARGDVLLAWEFKTQTTTDPLDPEVTNSLAAMLSPGMPLVGINSLTCDFDATTCPNGIRRNLPPYDACDAGDNNTQCFLKIALGTLAGASGPALYPTGNATCAAVGCAAIGDVLAGAVLAKQFQSQTPNPFDPEEPIPGPFADPLAPSVTETEPVQFIAFVPVVPAPAEGYPTVIFGHGLGSTKRSAFAIAPQLAAARFPPPPATPTFTTGFLTIAIDFVAHDSRAVRISDTDACANTDGPLGAGTVPPDPTSKPQCYAPFLSPNLAGTRDNIRQSVLDLQSLRNAIAACGATNCATNFPNFKFDNAHVSYLGISLGGIMGSMFTAVRSDVRAAVLNVPGVGWADILENTQTPAIKCSLVDGLIDAGILMGDKSSAGPTALCLGDEWKTMPGYRQFSVIGRWVLDPADPANFTQKLATRRILIQEAVGDLVVPNIATDNEAALVGLTSPITGACAPNPTGSPGGGGPTPPTPELLTMPMTNKFVKYADRTPAASCPDATGTPQPTAGTVFEHSTLLRPAQGRCNMNTMQRCSVDAQCTTAGDTCNAVTVAAGRLGTVRMQTDAITYLIFNR